MATPSDKPRTGLTYGTFDLFHIGHLKILQRSRALCDRLVVGISTDEFNAVKGKRTAVPFADRAEIVSALRCVDDVFPEESWEQKPDDITRYGVDLLVMGDDWQGEFDDLKELCEVSYLARTRESPRRRCVAMSPSWLGPGHRLSRMRTRAALTPSSTTSLAPTERNTTWPVRQTDLSSI